MCAVNLSAPKLNAMLREFVVFFSATRGEQPKGVALSSYLFFIAFLKDTLP